MTTTDIILTRTLDAPVERVWAAWTRPQIFRRWWGPAGFTCESATTDLREGGRFLWNMRAPAELGGFDMYTAGTFTRILPLESIEFVQHLSNATGDAVDPTTLGMPADFPRQIRSALHFADRGDSTELVAIEYDWPDGEQREFSAAGLEQCIDKLEALLPELADER